MPHPKRTPDSRPDVTTSTDLLARAYLDILARSDGAHSKPMLRSGSGDPADSIELLLDDLMDTPVEERVSVRPDLAAVAVLTARAIEAEPALTRILRRGAPVVTIATHTADHVASVKKVIQTCSLPSERTVVTGARQSRTGRDEALIVARDAPARVTSPTAATRR